MVVIRLARFGSVHSPKYRITVADKKYAAKKRYLEVIGHYNPFPRGKDVEVVIDMDKFNEWVKKGAQPSDRVKFLVSKNQKSAAATV